MLKAGEVYRDNGGNLVAIGGRIKAYCDGLPFVWSIAGNWYDEVTGRMVIVSRSGGYSLSVRDTWRCISSHVSVKRAGGE